MTPQAARPALGRVLPVLATCLAVALTVSACSDEEQPAPSGSAGAEAASEGTDAVAVLVETGLAQMAAGRDAAARGTFENVLVLEPDNLYALYNLGLLAQNAGDDERAAGLYDQALAVDDAYAPALYNRAILAESDDLDAAVALYRRAVAADPEFAAAFMRLGFALVHLGETAEGEAFLEQGVNLDPAMANVDAPDYG